MDALETRVAALEEKTKEHDSKIDELEKRTIETAVMIKNIDQNVSQVKRTLEKILDKPSERWDVVVAAALSGIVTYVMSQIGIF